MFGTGEPGPAELAVNGAYALVVVAVLTEGAWLVLRDGAARLRSLASAALMGAVAVFTGLALAAAHLWAWTRIGAAAPEMLVRLWRDHPALGVVAAFVAWDLAGYWYHRIGHRTALGWASHRVHHSGRHYDLSLAWRQPWLPLHALAVFPLVALGGFRLGTALVCAALSNLYQALLHTAAPLRLPRPLAEVLMAPPAHRRHHLAGGAPVNLGPVLTVWDRLFGTWDPTPVPDEARYGLDGEPTDNPLRILSAGWRALLARNRSAGSVLR